MSYDEYLKQWYASMNAKYKDGLPDFDEKGGRMQRRAAFSNRISKAIDTWGTEVTSNVTPRRQEKTMARTSPQPAESNVVPMRRGA